MSTTEWIVLAVAVVLLIGALAFMFTTMRKGNRSDSRRRAQDIRERADERAAGLDDERLEAHRADAEAGRARRAADDAEARAEEARTGVAQEEALHEDRLRAADRLDPDVDHRADDYSPRSGGTTSGPTT